MVGGDRPTPSTDMAPIFDTLAPGVDAAERTPGATGDPSTAETGLAALRPERRRPLRQDGAQRHRVRPDGRATPRGSTCSPRPTSAPTTAPKDAETAPLTHPEYYQYDLDLAAITEVWRRGSVVVELAARPHRRGARRRPRARRIRGRRQRQRRGSLDDPRGDRRRRAGARAVSAALYARFDSRGRCRRRRQDAVRDARPVRRPRRRNRSRHDEQLRMTQPAPRRRARCCSAPPATSPSASCSRRCIDLERHGSLQGPGDRRRPQRLDRRGVPRARPGRDPRRHTRRRPGA